MCASVYAFGTVAYSYRYTRFLKKSFAWLQYITVLRKNNMRARLKEARRAMQERFPLGERLWLDWLEDECAEKRKDVDAILELFELAVRDYLSVQLWTIYLQ